MIRIKVVFTSYERGRMLETPAYDRITLEEGAIRGDDVLLAVKRSGQWLPTRAVTTVARDYGDVFVRPVVID